MENISSSLGFGSSPSDQKTALMNQVRQEAAIQNARQLVEKINEHCFEKCIAKPGSSFSSGEKSCFSQCVEKYVAAWDTVSKQYLSRIQQEKGRGGGAGAGAIF